MARCLDIAGVGVRIVIAVVISVTVLVTDQSPAGLAALAYSLDRLLGQAGPVFLAQRATTIRSSTTALAVWMAAPPGGEGTEGAVSDPS